MLTPLTEFGIFFAVVTGFALVITLFYSKQLSETARYGLWISTVLLLVAEFRVASIKDDFYTAAPTEYMHWKEVSDGPDRD